MFALITMGRLAAWFGHPEQYEPSPSSGARLDADFGDLLAPSHRVSIMSPKSFEDAQYLATVTEFLEGDDATQVASGDVDATLEALQPLAQAASLTFGEPADAVDQNAYAVTTAFADKVGVTTLSELADKCSDGSLILGGPAECPTRPFCQPGLEDTYGLKFASFQEYGDTGGPLTKAAIQKGEVSIGLVFSSDGALAQ